MMSMAATGRPPTCTGTRLSICELFPICPLLLNPQANTAPSARSARAWSTPAVTLTMFDSPGTCSGELEGKLSPLPSWPSVLSPHAHTVPSFLRATAKSSPAETESTPENDGICVGDIGPGLVLPRPSCPCPLYPQANTTPSLRTANEEPFIFVSSPAATSTIPAKPGTAMGTSDGLVVPSPSCPAPLLPHA